jgi:hypothetical protein
MGEIGAVNQIMYDPKQPKYLFIDGGYLRCRFEEVIKEWDDSATIRLVAVFRINELDKNSRGLRRHPE